MFVTERDKLREQNQVSRRLIHIAEQVTCKNSAVTVQNPVEDSRQLEWSKMAESDTKLGVTTQNLPKSETVFLMTNLLNRQ
jgi:isopentenyl diphosphate isomerase/L-lactate dehydrogenase-like FMN-dependent dehydrogenase